MNPPPRIRSERHERATWITIDNPARRNALDYAMWVALGDALAAVHTDPDVRVLVLRGEGDRAFSAGNDITELGQWRDDPGRRARYDQASARAGTLLRDLPVPSIALIHGACVGGGLELALRCDLRLAAEDARFAITPARLGIGYRLSDVELVIDAVGASAARRLLYTASLHDATQALTMGLISHVHPGSRLTAEVEALALQIAANAPLCVRALKAAITEATKPATSRDRERVQALVDACDRSADQQEGRRAFVGKRRPVFVGR